jgi:hypothetical protein
VSRQFKSGAGGVRNRRGHAFPGTVSHHRWLARKDRWGRGVSPRFAGQPMLSTLRKFMILCVNGHSGDLPYCFRRTPAASGSGRSHLVDAR